MKEIHVSFKMAALINWRHTVRTFRYTCFVACLLYALLYYGAKLIGHPLPSHFPQQHPYISFAVFWTLMIVPVNNFMTMRLFNSKMSQFGDFRVVAVEQEESGS